MGLIWIIILILIVFILIQYNQLIGLRNKVKQSASGIDIYLNQRFDLIPNLVECVKAYSKYEMEVLVHTVELRNQYNQNKGLDFMQANEINQNMNKILAMAENYPALKSSEQYLLLQKNLIKIESQLQAARRIYNNEVTNYNTKIDAIPTNLIAKLFRFRKEELFQIEEYKKEEIHIDTEE